MLCQRFGKIYSVMLLKSKGKTECQIIWLILPKYLVECLLCSQNINKYSNTKGNTDKTFRFLTPKNNFGFRLASANALGFMEPSMIGSLQCSNFNPQENVKLQYKIKITN